MSENISRRDAIAKVARSTVLIALGSTASFLVRKANGQVVWQVDSSRCVNSRLGEAGTPICNRCTTQCVVTQSAVRAVNNFAKCGRCSICPAYFDITSAVDEKGLPSKKRCPRNAITRTPIGLVDPDDPANNFYEYTIDEARCDGCGICVKACMEPLGLGSIVLKIRYDLCVDCNRCAIAPSCPNDAVVRQLEGDALAVSWPEHP